MDVVDQLFKSYTELKRNVTNLGIETEVTEPVLRGPLGPLKPSTKLLSARINLENNDLVIFYKRGDQTMAYQTAIRVKVEVHSAYEIHDQE